MTAASAPALRIVATSPTNEQILRQLVADRDAAVAVLARIDVLIGEHGRAYIAEKYPHAREFLAPDLQRIRRELRQ